MIDRADYDPDWERRWTRAHERLASLPPSASTAEARAALLATYLAHDAQFQTVEALAAFRFDLLKRSAFADGYLLAMRPLGPEATEESIGEAWRSAQAQIAAAKRAASRPPLGQPEGLTPLHPCWSSGRPGASAWSERSLRAGEIRTGPLSSNSAAGPPMSAWCRFSPGAAFIAASRGWRRWPTSSSLRQRHGGPGRGVRRGGSAFTATRRGACTKPARRCSTRVLSRGPREAT